MPQKAETLSVTPNKKKVIYPYLYEGVLKQVLSLNENRRFWNIFIIIAYFIELAHNTITDKMFRILESEVNA